MSRHQSNRLHRGRSESELTEILPLLPAVHKLYKPLIRLKTGSSKRSVNLDGPRECEKDKKDRLAKLGLRLAYARDEGRVAQGRVCVNTVSVALCVSQDKADSRSRLMPFAAGSRFESSSPRLRISCSQ